MVNIVPYFLVGGVFAGNKIFSDLESSEGSTKPSGTETKEKEISENFPKDWRRLRPSLTKDQVIAIAKLSPQEIREMSQQYNVTEKTIQNWRSYARAELQQENTQ